MEYRIVEMSLNRYDELLRLWEQAEGVYVSEDDTFENLKRFLKRNPGSNFMAVYDDQVIAAVKCSHDGRKGYIHHLAVDPEYRNNGIARELINKCLGFLKDNHIRQVRLFVLDTNSDGLEFWGYMGFEEKVYDYRTFQKDLGV